MSESKENGDASALPTSASNPSQVSRDPGSEAAWEAGMSVAFGNSPSSTIPFVDLQVGMVLEDKYKLTERIGEGGMGSIWVAQQAEPVKRKVAIKLIKRGMDTKQVLARFDAERQALALMDHPNIAKVLDGGVAPDGRPFFVMELVKGVPITEYCDAHKLDPNARLELFVDVCHAIQHAHQKGIIHRDIKPSNVLVALYDDRPVPKVIDFGVAKATGGALTEQTIDTCFGSVVGTPQYMSPEQATLNNLDIDTRSDVYSLGVLLYELLVGSPPFSRKDLEKQGVLEMLRVVREVEPQRPSTKLSTADALPSLSANRSTEPKKLSGLLRNELDWIVMKSLEKDRARRYETANGFAADIRRYLAGEAIAAHPPSAAYRLQKFVRRHKVKVLASIFIVMSLMAGVVGTSLGLFEAQRQAKLAMEREKGERAAKQEAQMNERRAIAAVEKERQATELTAERLKQIEQINSTVFNIFADFDIRKNRKDDEPIEQRLVAKLVEAGKELDAQAIHDPLVLARLRFGLGQTLVHLGNPGAAIDLLSSAVQLQSAELGSSHEDTLSSMDELGQAYQGNGKPDLAAQLHEKALKELISHHGRSHKLTAICMNNLAMSKQSLGQTDEALSLYQESLELLKRNFGPAHRNTLSTLGNIAEIYVEQRRPEQAIPVYEEVLAISTEQFGAEHYETLGPAMGLASAYSQVGRLDEAHDLYTKTLASMKSKLGPNHSDTLSCMSNMAINLMQKDGEKSIGYAIDLLKEIVDVRRKIQGNEHPETLRSMDILASAYFKNRQNNLAIALMEEAVKVAKDEFGLKHALTLELMSRLAVIYSGSGEEERAISIFEETLPAEIELFGKTHTETLDTMKNLEASYQNLGKFELALPKAEQLLELLEGKHGKKHPDTLRAMHDLGICWSNLGKRDRAKALLTEAYQLSKNTLGPTHAETLKRLRGLLKSSANKGIYAPEEASFVAGLLEDAIESLDKAGARNGSDSFEFRNTLGVNYYQSKRLDKSIPLYRSLLEDQEAKLGRDHPQTQISVGNLGVNLLEAQRTGEAIPFLEEAYDSAMSGRNEMPRRILETNLMEGYALEGKATELQELVTKLLKDSRTNVRAKSPQLAGILFHFGRLLFRVKLFPESEALLRESLEICESRGLDDWRIDSCRAILGANLLGQKKFAEAEPMLEKAWDGLRRNAGSLSKKESEIVPETIDRLIEVANALEKPENSQKWQSERTAYENTHGAKE